MIETIDTFDGNHRRIGTEERLAAHKAGLWHQTFHCWILGERTGHCFVVLQLRSAMKKNYPNMLDITAAGHLAAGETPEQGVREVEEELGVRVDPSRLRSLGIKHDIADEPNGIRNREFAYVFLLRDDRELEQYKLQDDEVSGLVEMSISDGLQLFSGEAESVTCKATRIEGGKVRSFSRAVKSTDMIPRVDSYYFKVFIMAERMLEGARYLSI
jgi:isopentenyldiphosphate isomerase